MNFRQFWQMEYVGKIRAMNDNSRWFTQVGNISRKFMYDIFDAYDNSLLVFFILKCFRVSSSIVCIADFEQPKLTV